jgi:hypothetical protein
MGKVTKHILIPAIAPGIVIGLYFTPVAVVGCANRGLMALSVVLVSLIAGLATTVKGLKAKARNDTAYAWWITSAGILAIPTLLVLGPLG